MARINENLRTPAPVRRGWRKLILGSLMYNLVSSIELYLYPLKNAAEGPSKNTMGRFFAAWCGSCLAITVVSIVWLVGNNLISAFLEVLRSIAFTDHPAVVLLIVAFFFPWLVMSAAIGFMVSLSSPNNVTAFTLMIRGMVVTLLFTVMMLAVGAAIYAGRWAVPWLSYTSPH